MDDATRVQLHQMCKEEGQWMTYWQRHPHLPRWHAQTAVRHMRDGQLSHYISDVWSGQPLRPEGEMVHEDACEVWTSSPTIDDEAETPIPGSATMSDSHGQQPRGLVLRCLVHRNTATTAHSATALGMTTSAAESTTTTTSRNDDDGDGKVTNDAIDADAPAEATTAPPTTGQLGTRRAADAVTPTSTSPSTLFAALSRFFYHSVAANNSNVKQQHHSLYGGSVFTPYGSVASAVSPSPPPSKSFMVRFQCSATSGIALVWFRQQLSSLPGTALQTASADDTVRAIDSRISEALAASGLSSSWAVGCDRVHHHLTQPHVDATTRRTTATTCNGCSCCANEDLVRDVSLRCAAPARLFTDALVLQGAAVHLMRRAPFHHPHTTIQEVFEVFGPCTVKDWKHHHQNARGAGGNAGGGAPAVCAPAFVITFTGERYTGRDGTSLDDEEEEIGDAAGDALTTSDGVDDQRRLRKRRTALIKKRCRAAEDAAFALVQLQRCLAVDWGLVLTHQFGPWRRGEVLPSVGPPVATEVADEPPPPPPPPPYSEHIKDSIGVADPPPPPPPPPLPPYRDHSVPSVESLVPTASPVGTEVGVAPNRPKRKVYVPPSVAASGDAYPTALCPQDGSCALINDPAHQQHFLHRCTMPHPCTFATHPLHGPFFLHN